MALLLLLLGSRGGVVLGSGMMRRRLWLRVRRGSGVLASWLTRLHDFGRMVLGCRGAWPFNRARRIDTAMAPAREIRARAGCSIAAALRLRSLGAGDGRRDAQRARRDYRTHHKGRGQLALLGAVTLGIDVPVRATSRPCLSLNCALLHNSGARPPVSRRPDDGSFKGPPTLAMELNGRERAATTTTDEGDGDGKRIGPTGTRRPFAAPRARSGSYMKSLLTR